MPNLLDQIFVFFLLLSDDVSWLLPETQSLSSLPCRSYHRATTKLSLQELRRILRSRQSGQRLLSPVNNIEMHTIIMEEGVSKMRPIKGGVIVKAGESLEFKPMGYHLMFFDINEKLIEGELMNAHFRFKNSKDLLVKFKVESNKSSHDHEH